MLIVIQLIRNGDMACTGILVVFLMKARVCDNMRAWIPSQNQEPVY